MTGLTGRVVVFFVVVVLRVVDTFLGSSVVLNGGFLVVTSISFVVTWLSFSSVIVFRRPLIVLTTFSLVTTLKNEKSFVFVSLKTFLITYLLDIFSERQ